ncbi:ATP-dependent DNA helicase [Glaciihabitans sp. dw_435]|uniref:ATP-dependent DNA helicase n=1 Tax=Glaciihabitans sp. dw_435 TaxID=2720081 RepID=UPI0027DC7FDF|nr:ATP-dependent DNA helicase [Glaciihabitans sp. dw_435]
MTDLTDVSMADAPGIRLAVGANDIADALGMFRPTEQQRAVIEAPLTPALVVAGAGSGKTETMANRVLWLLANGHVRAGEILGLTFTRKAAGELAQRIRDRIDQLADAGLVPGDYDAFDAPIVATYNSFSNTIYRDHAILLGRESDGDVLGEASAWQLARSIVVSSHDERLATLDKSVDTITKAVLNLSHAVTENLADAEEVRAMAARFGVLADLPPGGRGEYAAVADLARTVSSLDPLLDLALQFSAAKASRGFVEYSDQVALALEIVRKVPRVGEELRARHRVVLLDEYQDTSVVQTWLLSELFAGQPVMAVGDPNQSIYGWRGASAANLEGFATQFGNGRVENFNLTTSWRNGHRILSVANALVEPLIPETRVRVERLDAGPIASDLPVDVLVAETVEDEADATARWLKQHLAPLDPKTGLPPTAALLFRARKSQPWFIAALRKHQIPFHVLGVGGLMAEPEIADLVSALRVLNDPTAGSELIRLLAGSRWRIGVRDLHALHRVASWLRDRDYAQKPYEDDVKDQLRSSVADGEGGSIVDALDFVATARDGHSQLEKFSELGLTRLRDAGKTFARLRQRSGLDLLDFITVVEQELMLDIEVVANDFRALGGANREAFFDALGSFIAVDDSSTLGGFLGWLKEAEWRDGLAPRPEKAEAGTVQLLTIHGSKGLEWDLVAVPRLVEDELPGKPLEGSGGWLSFGSLPWPFRGDAAELPEFLWELAESRKDVLESKAEFGELVSHRHELEERRLAYVAVTRARHSLLLTASFWATQTKPRRPSSFLRELEAAGVIDALPEASEFDDNPLGDQGEMMSWPLDPLGSRRSRVEEAAEAVRAADPQATGRWGAELELLLAERAARLNGAEVVAVPTRVPASRFKDFVTDPAAVAASLRRPMPERPYRATRLGTLFHGWVEQRYGESGGGFEELDALSTEVDGDTIAVDDTEFARLKAIFERSPWAMRAPVEVEREIHLILDGQIFVCKIDAVYFDGERYQVVDWKTGKAPKTAKDLEDKQLQLALYRLAYARWKDIDPELIDAVFYYVSDDRVITPERIFDEQELLALWRASLGEA